MKWNARVSTNVTVDFEIEAETESEVKSRIREYLAFVQGGNPEGQALAVKTKAEDKVTGLFVDIDEIADVYDL